MKLNWVDVNDRMPSDWCDFDDELLIAGEKIPSMKTTYPVLATDGKQIFIDRVVQMEGEKSSFYLNRFVSHWMYLPELPRCGHCDGTGYVHSIDGEYLGFCTCADADIHRKGVST